MEFGLILRKAKLVHVLSLRRHLKGSPVSTMKKIDGTIEDLGKSET